MELVINSRVSDEPTSQSFHFHWDGQVFWCLNYQLPMWIGLVIAYLNPKLLAMFWFYQWFLHPISKPQELYKLQYCHLTWIKYQSSKTCEYRYIHLLWIFWEEYRRSALLRSELYWPRVRSKTMGISMIVHFSGRCPPHNLFLFFMYFIICPTVACIYVEYRPLYILLIDKVC